MIARTPFDLAVPVLYVNPPCNEDPALIQKVSGAGGLGIVDHVTAGRAGFEVPSPAPYGLRVRLEDIKDLTISPDVKAFLLPLEDAAVVAGLEAGALGGLGVPVLVEVGGKTEAGAAEKAGAAALIARGCEGPGWVSETNGLVLIQEILSVTGLPVFLQGGVSFRSAAGVMAAGVAGVVLDVHLLLTEQSAISEDFRQFLRGLGLPASMLLAEQAGGSLRVYSRVGTRIVREMRKQEESLLPEEFDGYRDRLRALVSNYRGAPDSDDMLLPLSEDIAEAQAIAEEYGSAESALKALSRQMASGNAAWPFEQGAALCSDHGTRFPVVQGPMAHVSDNPDFLAAVLKGGALPVLAMGNMPAPIAKESLRMAAEKTQGCFGVGLIGLEVNRDCYEAHLEIMKESPPPMAVLAAGSPDLARRVEAFGTACYLHCPSPAILGEALKSGHRRFVFEGCESGGHIGTLGSLNLWTENLRVLDRAARGGLSLDEVSVLFAGGIATGRAAAFVAGMAADLAAKGLKVGLQLGTAYLCCEEAVSTCAITSTYQQLVLESDRTVVIGRTVNTKARAAGSPMAARLVEREQARIRDGITMGERKALYEKDNLGALRLASKGCAIDPETAATECPVFCDLPPQEQLDRGLYLMGQVASLMEKPCTMEELHLRIMGEGREIFQSRLLERNTEKSSVESYSFAGAAEVEMEKEPIAVVGIGLRFPGSDSPETFWEQIITGRSGICPLPEGRWEDDDYYYDPDPRTPDKTYAKIGGFITDFHFDPLKYRIPPAVARKMDRSQQLAVACVADALVDAGLHPEQLRGKRVGIILGNSMGGETTDLYATRLALPRTLACLGEALSAVDLPPEIGASLLDRFQSRFLENLPGITEDSLPGELANVISGRVANVFNLEGPNFTVDAACASSMAAAMNAVKGLRDGTMDCALTGGVDSAMHPSSFVKFCKIGALSPDGSRPFDESANGFVMGEGAGVLVLKRLSDAIRDNDRIYAVILDVGSSSDGRGKGITAPNALGQERAVLACLEAAGVPIESVGLIEAHGTSTAVGDKTELTVLDGILRAANVPAGSVGIGSVKSQIGHLKAAAGAAGMIKTILSLHHKTLPPTINVTRPNPCIEWDSSPLSLLTESRPWKPASSFPRRGGVSAFGFGGTNFHVMVQEHVPGLRVIAGRRQAPVTVEFKPPEWPRPPKMEIHGEAWVVGGRDEEDLGLKLEAAVKELTPSNWSDVSARLRRDSEGQQLKCGFAANDAESCSKKLTMAMEAAKDPSKRPLFSARGIHISGASGERARGGLAFLFPGQGSQYPFMMRDLAERFPVVAQTFEEADEILASLGLTTVSSCAFPGVETGKEASREQMDLMKDTQLLQPMILTADTAIFRLLRRMGIRPVAVAGHSLGEYAACVAAGVFSFRDALEAVAVRGREMARVSIADPGLMMSIPADSRVVDEILSRVDGYVVAANKNSPKQTVISGETHAVKKAGELFKERGLEGILLPVSAAFHSGVVAPAREPFMKTLERLTVKPPEVPVLSNVTGDFYPVGPAAAGRIRDLLGKQFAAPVEWVKTLRRLYSEGVRIFVECGPKRVMTNLTADTLPNDVLALPTNHPKKGGILQLMETLAVLACEGVPADLAAAEATQPEAASAGQQRRPELRVVAAPASQPEVTAAPPAVQVAPDPLEGLLDEEIREIAAKNEFRRFLELQGEPIRSLIKSGFRTFVKNVLPLDMTVKQVQSEGMNFKPVVVSGIAAGLPSDVRFPFDRETLDDLILGRNFIKKIPETGRREMLEKNVERLVKGPSGEADLQMVDDISGVIKLAGYFHEGEIIREYDVDERLVKAMDVTSSLAIAAGFEALRDAGIPLVRHNKTTSTGHELPDSWSLPKALQEETGVIFASAFPGMASMVDEVTREAAARYGAGAKKRLIEFYSGLIGRIRDDIERERITKWFTSEFNGLGEGDSEELYTFNRSFLLKVTSMAHGQFAQLIKARGPNTHLDAACATTTQAVLIARDWIRTGQANRVIVVAADDVAGKTLLPWIGSGFLAMGAATTNGNLSEAALPFDDRRHGLILGSAAVGMILESSDLCRDRGMEAIASVEAGMVANSGFHGTRLDVEHISSLMDRMVAKWEEQSGGSRQDLARSMFFMSHETYSPKRGGSSAAEMQALRRTFGEAARLIPIANTKGFTGHTMGVGVEDVVALRCLQKRLLPPIPNLRKPDPDFADLNLSKGGPCEANYALRLAAGFGSQIVMALYKVISREENRITDLGGHREWLKEVTGYSDPMVTVENRVLRVGKRVVEQIAAGADKAPAAGSNDEAGTALAGSQGTRTGEDVRGKVLSLLSQKTGYPPEMLDTGLDLEADLGIDTVKQAEFISEVRETFGIPRIEGLKIADFPTIEHIIGFVTQHTDRGATSGSSQEAEIAAEGSQEPAADEGMVREKILALLADKTGYPPEMLDTGLDLEADLGIDTVKQAEFIADVREMFGIPRIEGLKIADFPTINHMIGFVLEKSRQAAAKEKGDQTETPMQQAPAAEEEIRLYEARVVNVASPGAIVPVKVDRVIIAGGPEPLVAAIEQTILAAGHNHITRVDGPSLPENVASQRLGIINLFPLEDDPKRLSKTFGLYLALAASFDSGPAFLVTVVSEDGAYGFESPAADAHLSGAAAGATKSFAREFPETRVRMLDVHPDLNTEQFAGVVVRSINESLPVEAAVGKDGGLRTIRLVPVLEDRDNSGLRSGDVVLVTGGARGITAECLHRMAEQQPLTLVILGRTELSGRAEQMGRYSAAQWNDEKMKIAERLKRDGVAATPVKVERELALLKAEAEVFSNLKALREAGSEVIYRPTDVRDQAAVDSAIEEAAKLCGRVDVVIHAAGIDVSRALRGKALEQIETVVSVKLDGMRNLMQSLERLGLPPRRIVGFGSVAGRFGNMAQVDYSAANDGLAHMLRRIARESDTRVSIIDWAPWSEVGMAVRGSVQQALEAAGIDFIPPEKGADLLLQELGRTTGGVEVLASGRLGPFADDAFRIGPETAPIEAAFAGQRTEIVSMLAGEYVRARVFVDPTHPLLDHHRIDRAAVLPGVGGLEIMRAAACLLDPDAAAAGIENVRFVSPLKVFRQEPFEAEVEIVRVSVAPETKAYRGRISSWFINKEGCRVGSPRLHHECSLLLRNPEEASQVETPRWPQSVRIVEEDLYSVFFHGPAFRLLDHVVLEGNGKGIRFRYTDTEQRAGMFTDFIPSAIEAAFQAAAAFGIESRGFMALPVGIGRAEVYSHDIEPFGGELIFKGASVQEGPEGRAVLRADGTVHDREGKVLVKLVGVEMVELESGKSFPRKVFEEAVPVEEILERGQGGASDLLGRVLDDEEILEHRSKKVPKRAGEWLAGRIALKRSVHRLLATSGDAAPSLRSIRIVADDRRKPFAEISGRSGTVVGEVSLSHSNGLAIAAAAAPGSFSGLGLDMEKIEPRSDAWINDYFTGEEIRLAGSGEARWARLTGMWCLKEAALKALGTGLSLGLTDVVVTEIDAVGRANLDFRNQAAELVTRNGGGRLEARVEENCGYAEARVSIRTD